MIGIRTAQNNHDAGSAYPIQNGYEQKNRYSATKVLVGTVKKSIAVVTRGAFTETHTIALQLRAGCCFPHPSQDSWTVVRPLLWWHRHYGGNFALGDPLKVKEIVAFRFGRHIALHLHESRLSLASISILTVTCK